LSARKIDIETIIETKNKSVAIASGLHGCETRVMMSRNKNRLQDTEMRFLTLVTGKARGDKIKNNDIRNKLRMENLNNTLNRYRDNWKSRLLRMTENGISRQTVDSASGNEKQWATQEKMTRPNLRRRKSPWGPNV
jgi:hypothetical protein